MPVSTRDYQHDRRHSRLANEALAAITEGLDLFGDTVSTGLNHTILSEVRNSRHPSVSTVTNIKGIVEEQTTTETIIKQKRSLFGRYRWKMSHYFYLHLMAYIFNGLFGGFLICLIENYSSNPNKYMVVSYLDAWFTTVSTICSCGLTTIDFAQLSQASQLIMMGFAFISGFAISTLPALVIKAYTHRKSNGTDVDDDTETCDPQNDDELQRSNQRWNQNLPSHVRAELGRLPTPVQLRYRAYIMCIVLILSLYFIIYTTGFLAIGIWLQIHNTPAYLMQNNVTLSPWYVSGMLTLFSFNQNGLTPFSTSLARYVDDVFLNIVFVLVMLHICMYKFMSLSVFAFCS